MLHATGVNLNPRWLQQGAHVGQAVTPMKSRFRKLTLIRYGWMKVGRQGGCEGGGGD